MNIFEYAKYKKMFGGSGGGDTPSGNFKKKFMTFVCLDGIMSPLCSVCGKDFANDAYDEGILPTKTDDGIKVSFAPTDDSIYIYFIEDENALFLYGDPTGSGNNTWVPISVLFNGEELYKGVVTDPRVVNEYGVYVFVYYSEAEGE